MKDWRKFLLIALCVAMFAWLIVITTPYSEAMIRKQSNFETSLKVVLQHEGYISDDKTDRGGLTKYGLSLRFLQLESLDIDGDGDVDRDDVRAITKKDAYRIYFQKFWVVNGYDKIQSPLIATKLLDITVNTGGSRAHKILKKAINRVLNEGMKVDGNFDKSTLNVMNAIEPVVLMDAIRAEQAEFYRALVKKTPVYKVFEKGWLRRAAW